MVNDLRRHTWAYVKNLGGFPIIPDLPRREYKKKDRPIVEYSLLVGDWEELVETSLQEVELPLNQEGPGTPYGSPAQTPVGSPPHSPPRLMAGVNANQPPNPPNPPPAWRARSPLNLTPPLHDLPQSFEKLLPKFDPNEKILVDDHLQSFYLAIEGLRAGEHEDVVCRLFPHTLKGAAASWYFGLPANSIPDWNTFERIFRSKYATQKTHVALMKGLCALKKEKKGKSAQFYTKVCSIS